MDFCFFGFYTSVVKKIIFLLLSFFILLTSLSAETAFWLGESSIHDNWTNEEGIAFSDKYSPNSLLALNNGENSTSVKVLGPLPKTEEGRELGLTKKVLNELGLWGIGDSDIEIDLLKGSLIELEETEKKEKSGWYSLTLSPIELKAATKVYKTLVTNGFKTEVIYSDSAVMFKLLYIVEYEKEEKISLIEKLGLFVDKEEESPNPYL